MDLSQHVLLPREDFIELQQAAWDIHPTPLGQRIGTTVQTTLLTATLTAAVVVGTWGVAKAQDWLEENRFQRDIARDKARKTP